MAGETKLKGKGNAELAGNSNDSAGEDRPAVIVLHEYWGLIGEIRSAADRLAKEGFVIFVPDLFHAKVTTDVSKQAISEVRNVVDALRARGSQVPLGAIGFCIGAAVALLATANIPEISACVLFYGLPPDVQALKKFRRRFRAITRSTTSGARRNGSTSSSRPSRPPAYQSRSTAMTPATRSPTTSARKCTHPGTPSWRSRGRSPSSGRI